MILTIKYILKLEGLIISKESLKVLLDNSYFHYLKMVRTNQLIKIKNKENIELIKKIKLIVEIIESSQWSIEKIENNIVSIDFLLDLNNDLIKNKEISEIEDFFNENFLEFSKKTHLEDIEIWKIKLKNEDKEVAKKNIQFIIDFHLTSVVILNKIKIENINIKD
jgi:hypothetical protein